MAAKAVPGAKRPSAVEMRALAVGGAATLASTTCAQLNFASTSRHVSSTDAVELGVGTAVIGHSRPFAASPVSKPATSATVAVAVGAFAAFRQKQHSRRAKKATPMVARQACALADCPYTIFGTKDVDVSREQSEVTDTACPLEVHMPAELAGDLKGQRAYFEKNMPKIYKDLKKHGAVVFRGFELSKESETFKQVGEALGLEPCEDPLHSVAARDAVDQKAGVYEAVNKPSRRKFYVGMHNEMVGNRAPGAAIFVCFKAAEEGGEFLVADCRKLFRDLDKDWVQQSYERGIQYSTAEFPMGFVERLGPLQGVAEPVIYGVMQQALKMKVDFDTELRWERSEYDQSKILQVRGMPQPPIVRHPYTGEPAWWGSMHSHSEYLRSEREKVFGDEGFQETTGASRINKTDVYYADSGERVENERMRHLDEVTMKAAVKISMEKGDMVLLDNYMVMHGRCPFEGTRKHAVVWYKSPDYTKAAA